MGTIPPVNGQAVASTPLANNRLLPRNLTIEVSADVFTKTKIDGSDGSMRVVLDRAMEKLRAVVGDARAALGMPEDAVIDTSPEATANRIADFAIGAFSAWHKNHKDLSEDDARAQFASFIGGAIQQGISEARGILQGLSALSPEVDSNIDSTWNFIQQRLEKFVSGD